MIDLTKATDPEEIIGRVIQQANRPAAQARATFDTVLPAYQRNGAHNHRDGGCFTCGRRGHISRDCHHKARTFTEAEKDANYKKSLADKGTGRRRGGKGKSDKANVAKEQSAAGDLEHPETHISFLAMRENLHKHSWLLDSGSSVHITNNKSIFSAYVPAKNHTVVGIGSTQAEGIGSVKLKLSIGKQTTYIMLERVLYLPNSPHNLVSLGKLHRAGYRIEFPIGSLDVEIRSKAGTALAHCRNIGDVYALGNVEPVLPSSLSATNDPALVFIAKEQRTLEDWHRALGHLGIDSVKKLADKGMVEGMRIAPGSNDVPQCATCIQAKQTVAPFPKEAKREYSEVGEMTYTDVCGPLTPAGIHGEQYFITFTDGAKKYRKVAFMKAKSEAERHIDDYIAFVETQAGKKCKAFRFDGGGEYLATSLRLKLSAKGIRVETTARHSPQQNGVSERLNQTLMDRARAMILAHDLPKFLWPQAVSYSARIINCSPTRSLKDDITPFEGFWKRKPNIASLQEFGAFCWVLIQGEKPPKIGSRSDGYRFVGLSDDSAGWQYYVPKTRKILTSRNVVFEEGSLDEAEDEGESPLRLEGEGDKDSSEPAAGQQQRDDDAPATQIQSQQPHTPAKPTRKILQMPPREPRTQRNAAANAPTSYNENSLFRNLRNPSNLSPQKPDAWRHRVAFEETDMAHVAVMPRETQRQLEENPGFEMAMEVEFKQLEDMGTFSATDLPAGRKAIGTKWVLTDKDGTGENLKARLVVLGNHAIPGTDFNPDQISSPVVRAETNRLLIALAARYDLEFHVVDVKGAYLNGKLTEEVYIKQPAGFDDGSGKVLRLHKSLYGLPQAGRVWNAHLDARFQKMGFQRLLSDRCVYIRRAGDDIVIVAVHVDDMPILASNLRLIKETEDLLAQEFTIKRLGEPRILLGMEIERDRERGTITISQQSYIEKLLTQHGMEHANPVATPMDLNVKLEKLPKNASYPEIRRIYQSMVGGLMWAAITTRPDIAHAVQSLSQFGINPGPIHLTALKRVYRYLRGTTNLGITYSRNGNDNLQMYADFKDVVLYTDADWANNQDDRKSISGYVSMLSGGATTWSSKKQATVALSTMEAEYVALAHAARENIWLRSLFTELGIPPTSPIPILCDNRGAIDFSFNTGFHGRSKHIDMRHHFIRQKVESGEASVSHCASEDNLADIFTKPLSRDVHELQVHKLGMTRV